MKIKGWAGIVGAAVLTTGWLVSGQLRAETVLSDGYTLEDFTLRTAADLVDVCTIGQDHPDHKTAMGFCYGFFEGGTHYHILFPSPPRTIEFPVTPRGQRVQKPSRYSSLTFGPTPSMVRRHRLMRSSVPWLINGHARNDRSLMNQYYHSLFIDLHFPLPST